MGETSWLTVELLPKTDIKGCGACFVLANMLKVCEPLMVDPELWVWASGSWWHQDKHLYSSFLSPYGILSESIFLCPACIQKTGGLSRFKPKVILSDTTDIVLLNLCIRIRSAFPHHPEMLNAYIMAMPNGTVHDCREEVYNKQIDGPGWDQVGWLQRNYITGRVTSISYF